MPVATVPITDRDAAVDCLLDARSNLSAVRDSTLPGTAIYVAMARALVAVDDSIREIRRLS